MKSQFADDPAEFFGFDAWEAHQMPRAEYEPMQLAAFNARLLALKDKIPPLQALTDAQGITEVDNFDAIVPLLFPHNIYKAYPIKLVDEGDFATLTKWLSRLSVHDLAAIDGLSYETMDDWMDAIDMHTNIDVCHSSGTSGRLSFYPRGKHEVNLQHTITQMKFTERNYGRRFKYGDWFYSVIWPAQAFGRTSILRGAAILRSLVCEKDEDFYPYLPTVLSSDHHYYVMKCTKLLAQGAEDAPPPSEYVHMRLAEAEAVMRDVPQLQQRLLDTVAALKYKQRIMMFGTPIVVHDFAAAGLKRGMENMMMEDSFINTVGGFKDTPVNLALFDDIKKFTGDGTMFKDAYGMTELITGFDQCDYDRFHIPPWIITYLLDPKSGKVLPREGKQSGRAAFFDLPVQTYWGGTVTADNIDIDWGMCKCGRTTPTIGTRIDRMAESAQELYIGAAPDAAVDAAIEALNEGIEAKG